MFADQVLCPEESSWSEVQNPYLAFCQLHRGPIYNVQAKDSETMGSWIPTAVYGSMITQPHLYELTYMQSQHICAPDTHIHADFRYSKHLRKEPMW